MASVITYALEKIHITQTKDAKPEFPEPLTDNCYEKAVRLDNRNYEPENQGFVKDTRVQEEVKIASKMDGRKRKRSIVNVCCKWK